MNNLIWLALTAIFFVWQLFVRLTGDLEVSFAAAFLTDYYGSFPQNVLTSWNLRGFGYNGLLYLLYKFLGLFGVSPASSSFGVVAKTVYLIAFIGIAGLFFKMMKSRFTHPNLSWQTAFFIFTIVMLAVAPFCMMQPEHLASLYVVGMIAFALSENSRLNWLSGLFAVLLFSVKYVTLAFAGVAFLIVLYEALTTKNTVRLIRFCLSSGVAMIVTAFWFLFFSPQLVKDLKEATLFQSSFKLSLGELSSFSFNFFRSGWEIPTLLLGILVFSYLVINRIRQRKYTDLALLLLLIAIPAVAVFVQARYARYHYVAFLPVFVVCIYYCVTILNAKSLKLLGIVSGIGLGFWVILVTISKDFGRIPYLTSQTNIACERNRTAYERQQIAAKIAVVMEPRSASSILFLADGTVNYYIRNKSHLRHFLPLPIQRAEGNAKLKNSDVYKNVLAQALAYQGEYIIWDPKWFPLQTVPTLYEKLIDEYDSMSDPGERLILLKRKPTMPIN